MQRQFGFIVVFISIIFCINSSAQQLDVDKSFEHFRRAVNFYNQKDFVKACGELELANQYRPNYPRFMYSLASTLALSGKQDESIEMLKRIADFKIFLEADKDSDFVSIFDNPAFKNVIKQFYSNLEPMAVSEVAFTINQNDLLTEGVAFDLVDKSFYVSSVHKRKIVKYDAKGKQTDFVREAQDGIWSVFGLKVDSKNRLLYACSGTLKQTSGIDSTEFGKSGLFIYDLTNGKLINKIILTDEKQHLLGDLAIGPNGEVFTTDSDANIIYKLSSDGKNLEGFYSSKDFRSLQGIAFANDGRNLFVADYSTGIHKINLESKEKTILEYPKNLCVLGIDGLYFHNNSLIGIQNGIRPYRVIKMNLNAAQDKIESWEILESNNPLYNEPTLGVITGDYFYYIANSQWESFGNIYVPDAELQKPTILKLRLD